MSSFVKKIQKKVKLLPEGVKDWYKTFDKDGSDAIEFTEFLRMLEYLDIGVEERMVRMIFSLFDRHGTGVFKFIDFEDIIEGRMTPNYDTIARRSREQHRLE